MNIFVLDRDPVKAAQMMCDAHVVKMIIESCQLLSTHCRVEGRFISDTSGLYKATHINHPCRTCLDNIHNELWLISHTQALLMEYSHRYGRIHKAAEMYSKYWHCHATILSMNRRDDVVDKCTFPKCMPEEFRVGGDDIDCVVQSYRKYYKYKQKIMKRFHYTRRELPDWLAEETKSEKEEK